MAQILVIEDDTTVRTLILKLLQAEGFETMGAEDGRRGLDLAKIHVPHLIICDIMMPEMDGYEVLQQLQQDAETAAIPFIFLSARSERSDQRQGMNLGADDYLTKPFKRAELLEAVSARLTKQVALTQPYVDEMRRAAQTLSQLAYRDPLTNLPNRILLHHELQAAIAQAKQTKSSSNSSGLVGVFCVSLSCFKTINHNLGYANGDLLLKLVAQRLEQTFGDQGMVARLAGDEFALLVSPVDDAVEAHGIAQKMLRVLTDPYDLKGNPVQIQVSAGAAFYPENGNNPDRMLNQADTAMRCAKTQGGRGYQFYAPEMDALATERQQIERWLKFALENQEFQLEYQPQVNLITGRVIGAEALLRWHSADLGWVSPDKFIAIAEDTGLILPIGEWVLETACKQAKAWQLSTRLPLRVSINLSARQFRQETLVAKVAQMLKETGLSADLLVLEMTETSVMENVEATIQTLKELRAMGVHVSIDDFGTGYSSLNYLKRFPIDTLKIDQSFVREIVTDANDAAIVKAIIAMAQTLQLKVIAEGVETEEQFNFLRQSGCHAMQGYLFSPAISASQFEQLLLADKRFHPGQKADEGKS